MAGSKTVKYCAQHAKKGMVNLGKKECRTEGCSKQSLFGVAGTKTAEYRAQHTPDGMVNVLSKKCKTEGCGKHPSFGMADMNKREYCAQHAPDGMVNVSKRKFRTEGCAKTSSVGVASTKTVEYCAQDAPHGMFHVYNRKCRTEGYSKQSSFGEAGAKNLEYCTQHAKYGMVSACRNEIFWNVEECRRRKVDPHHSDVETVVNASPSGLKRKPLYPSSHASAPSDDSEDSRKRARQLDIMSAASPQTIAVQSAAVGVMSGTGWQQTPVTWDSSVKAEVKIDV